MGRQDFAKKYSVFKGRASCSEKVRAWQRKEKIPAEGHGGDPGGRPGKPSKTRISDAPERRVVVRTARRAGDKGSKEV